MLTFLFIKDERACRKISYFYFCFWERNIFFLSTFSISYLCGQYLLWKVMNKCSKLEQRMRNLGYGSRKPWQREEEERGGFISVEVAEASVGGWELSMSPPLPPNDHGWKSMNSFWGCGQSWCLGQLCYKKEGGYLDYCCGATWLCATVWPSCPGRDGSRMESFKNFGCWRLKEGQQSPLFINLYNLA